MLLGCSEVAEVLRPGGEGGGASGGASAGGSGGTGNASGVDSAAGAAGDAPEEGARLDAGNAHTCAVLGGALYCWGNNARGQLGVGDAVSRSAPVRVGADRDWTDVVAAAEHSCALKTDGSPWCFGADDSGQLGFTSSTDVLAPTRVTLPGPAAAISAEVAFTLVLLRDGSIYAWGANLEGQLGQGDTYPGADQTLPVRVGAENDWIAIDAGQGHACGIRAPGAVYCWGRNSQGQLGQGAASPAELRAPTRVGTFDDARAISAGQGHSCALLESGELWCWGVNTGGGLGTDDLGDRLSPTQIGGGGFAQVSLDTFHTCAVARDEGLWCWGRNVEGQLGFGDTTNRNTPERTPASPFRAVSAGRFHTCALRDDDSLWCTGANESGQLGTGDTERRSAFTRVVDPR